MIILLAYIVSLIFIFENILVSKKPIKNKRSQNVNWKLVEEMFGPEENWTTASSFAAGINNRNTFDKAR